MQKRRGHAPDKNHSSGYTMRHPRYQGAQLMCLAPTGHHDCALNQHFALFWFYICIISDCARTSHSSPAHSYGTR